MPALPHTDVSLLQTGASEPGIKGTVPFPPTTPVPIVPVAVGAGNAVELLGKVRGRPNGLSEGVIVVLPITIFGAIADTGTAVIVDDPLRVAVRVVKTSDNVVVRKGSLDAEGFVVGASVFDMGPRPTLEKNIVVVAVRSETCAKTVPPTFSPPP